MPVQKEAHHLTGPHAHPYLDACQGYDGRAATRRVTGDGLMRIVLVTPAPRGSRHGNRITARRWAKILRDLGHRVNIRAAWTGETCDLLIALHAWKSLPSSRRYHDRYPARPLIVALTGTDLYGDLDRRAGARQALAWASRLVVLHDRAASALPRTVRHKTEVIFQSVAARARPAAHTARSFDVCVLAHLRAVKDPFRAAVASRRLPVSSRVRILQVGGAMSAGMEARARAEAIRNPRYQWLGDVQRAQALRVLARSRLLVISSRTEGGANVVSEAIGCRVPVLASRIPGNLGLLGGRYPGTFAVGDTKRLARLIERAETDRSFLERLAAACDVRRPLFAPAREREAWRRLLSALT